MGLVLYDSKVSTSYNRATDTHYVYETNKYHEEETGKTVVKRRVIGKIDRETGETIPTNRHVISSPASTPTGIDYKEKYDQILEQMQKQNQTHNEVTRQLIDALTRSSQKMNRFIHDAQTELDQIHHVIELFKTR